MKYIGFEQISLKTVFEELKQTGNHLVNTPQDELFSHLKDQTCERFIIHQVDKDEFMFYSALFHPAKGQKISEASGGASHLLRFMPQLHGMIVDPLNDTGFVVMDNFLMSKTASFLDLVATKYELLPTHTEGNQVRRIARGYNQGHLNRGFKVKLFSVVDSDGKEIIGANLSNQKKNRIQFGDHTLKKLFHPIYEDSHRDLIVEALGDFYKFVSELKEVLEDDETMKFVFSSLHIIFIIDYPNRTYSIKLQNFKKCMRVENRDIWSKNYAIEWAKVLNHIEKLKSEFEMQDKFEEKINEKDNLSGSEQPEDDKKEKESEDTKVEESLTHPSQPENEETQN